MTIKSEVTVEEAVSRHAGGAIWLDVREPDEWAAAHIEGTRLVPMSEAVARVQVEYPDRTTPLVVSCASGARSRRVTDALLALGYSDVTNLTGGIRAWIEAGRPVNSDAGLTEQQRDRYSRHLLIPEIGVEGQQKLLGARVLMLGAGGLGSPAALYLAAAGVGTIGIVDDDVVDRSNLQRQILHNENRIGVSKAQSAAETIGRLNPDVKVLEFRTRMTSDNVMQLLEPGWDVIVDGTDNFPTRYLVNDASIRAGIPVVHGSIYRFEGQLTVFDPHNGPCYRCLFPEPPPPELAPSCAEGGVLGVLPGIVGSLQANEAIKLITGVGEPLRGKLLLMDALTTEFRTLTLQRDEACPSCSDPDCLPELIDYEAFCAIR